MFLTIALSNYAKNATGVEVSKFVKDVDLACLKSKVDKLDVNKLAPVPVDLSKLSEVVKTNVVKNT